MASGGRGCGQGHSMAFQPKVGRYVLDFSPTSHIHVSWYDSNFSPKIF